MRANKGKNTKPELLVRRLLREAGHRGYRLHRKGLPGRPDVSFGPSRLAIFVHGCFWHKCPRCFTRFPKSNRWYWMPKLRKNVERDRLKRSELRKGGWRVQVIWEHELAAGRLPRRVLNALGRR
jgi:DNA mismatch endonuclease (patch repair protein)